ncbi:MAG: imidazolonepropionase [Flavobacteriaceae bacterium]
MRTVFINIRELLQVRPKSQKKVVGLLMKELPKIDNAFLAVEDERIVDFGPMAEYIAHEQDIIIDATDRLLMPTWCDSHSHVVYAGNRSQEFVDRINGLSYEDIAQRGGGILNSAKTLQNTSEDDLFEQSIKRIQNLAQLGTGALEIKSGYGLTTDAELKMLRVIKKIGQHSDLKIKATFLGAHAVPEQFKNNKSAYIDLIINEMLPKVSQENLADFVDVFCEKGYFDLDDTNRILSTAKAYNLKPKIHVNQFNAFGGVALGVKHNALSVDHLEELSNSDIEALKDSETIPVALPGCSFFLGIPYTPARQLLEQGLPIALASDYNPGSAPSGNMNFVVSLACIKMNMTPEEAINAATLNGAYAMGISEDFGSIALGKKAHLILTKKMDSYHQIPYEFGHNPVEKVMLNGKFIEY